MFPGLITLGASLVVWQNVTAVKDVLSLQFVSRDEFLSPLVARCACRGAVALCSLAHGGELRVLLKALKIHSSHASQNTGDYANQNTDLYCLITSQMCQGFLASR